MVSAEDNDSDAESVAKSEALGTKFDVNKEEFVANIVETVADDRQAEYAIAKKAGSTDASNRANMPDEIFDYIHVVRCRQLFSLAWYDDLTYVAHAGLPSPKALPNLCCNGPSCQSPVPACLQREPFIQVAKTRYSEKQECARLRMEPGIKWLSHSVVMPDSCIAALAKSGDNLLDTAALISFLVPWNCAAKRYCEEILTCLRRNSSRVHSEPNNRPKSMPSDAERKATLQAARLSKKLKHLDDALVTKAWRIDALRDQWRMENEVADDATKARVKKARSAIEKADAPAKAKGKAPAMKAGAKNDALNVRRFALTNSQRNEIGTYAATLLTDSSTAAVPAILKLLGLAGMRAQKQTSSDKKKAVVARFATAVPRIELNKESTKRTVRVTAKAVANTPTKQMHMVRPDSE
ncbi:hypothetical protein MMC07_009335 [Pseudocyphellaria aurata]|nr:hypothetical protein [Pseudocyphellaria aurata]